MKMLLFVLAAAALVTSCNARPPDSSDPKIIGGHESGPHPFMAGLTDEGGTSAYCGGSFIAPDVVLTAAHCVKDAANRMRVSAGLHLNSGHAGNTTIAVKAVRIHPDFGPNQAFENDLALLFLGAYDPATLPGPIVPIALNADLGKPAAAATVIGWGNTSSYGSLFEDGLREVEVPVVSLGKCANAYPGVGATQICAGDFDKGGVDSCQGDSGGPLVIPGDGGVPVLAGLVSFGNGCALAKFPGVYTRVASFKGWIEAEVQRFHAAPAAPTPQDVTDFVRGNCYALLKGQVSAVDGLNDIRLVTSYAMDGLFAPAAAAPAASDAMTPCAYTLAGGDQWTVALAKTADGAPKALTATRAASGERWTVAAKPAVKADLYCAGDADNASLNLVFDPDSGLSYVYLKGQYFDLGGAFTGTVPEAPEVTRACKVNDFALRFLKIDGNYVAELSSPLLGGTKRFETKLYGGSDEKLALAFAPTAPKTGTMTLENTLDDDLFTWDLGCDAAMTLTDANGATIVGVARNGFFHFQLVTPESAFGTVRAHQKVAFKYQAGGDIGTATVPECSVNGRAVNVTVAMTP